VVECGGIWMVTYCVKLSTSAKFHNISEYCLCSTIPHYQTAYVTLCPHYQTAYVTLCPHYQTACVILYQPYQTGYVVLHSHVITNDQ